MAKIYNLQFHEGEGEGVVAVKDKRWDRRSSEALIKSATPCHGGAIPEYA